MAKQTNDYKPTGFRMEAVEFNNAGALAQKTLVAAGADDSVIVQFSAVSLSTSDESIRLSLWDGSNDFFLFDVPIPAGSGSGIIPAVDILAFPAIYNAALPLEQGWSLLGVPNDTISATGDVTLTAIITDF